MIALGVIRVEHNSNYTTMANYHFRDRRLSLRAIGLMSKMLSLPEDWDYTVKGLASICVEGREAVRKVLMELEAAGYLIREQNRVASGAFSGYDYTLRECPEGLPGMEISESAEDSPSPGKLGNGAAPLPENPDPGFPSQSNKQEEKNPPKAPQGGRRRKKPILDGPEWKPERFAGFWRFYPNGNHKQAAIRAWDALRPDDDLIDEIGRALKRQMSSELWQRGIGIPEAAAYLNQARWTDEGMRPMGGDAPHEEVLREWT